MQFCVASSDYKIIANFKLRRYTLFLAANSLLLLEQELPVMYIFCRTYALVFSISYLAVIPVTVQSSNQTDNIRYEGREGEIYHTIATTHISSNVSLVTTPAECPERCVHTLKRVGIMIGAAFASSLGLVFVLFPLALCKWLRMYLQRVNLGTLVSNKPCQSLADYACAIMMQASKSWRMARHFLLKGMLESFCQIMVIWENSPILFSKFTIC